MPDPNKSANIAKAYKQLKLKNDQEVANQKKDELNQFKKGYVPSSNKYKKQLQDYKDNEPQLTQGYKSTEKERAFNKQQYDSKEWDDKKWGYYENVATAAELGNFVPHPAAQVIGKAGSVASAALAARKAKLEYDKGNYLNAGLNAGLGLFSAGLGAKTGINTVKASKLNSLERAVAPSEFVPGTMGNFNTGRIQYKVPNYLNTFAKNNPDVLKNRASLGLVGTDAVTDFSTPNNIQHADGGPIDPIKNKITTPATKADSLAVFNNTKAIEDYFLKNKYIKQDVKDDKRYKQRIKNTEEIIKDTKKWLKEAQNMDVSPFTGVTVADKNKAIKEAKNEISFLQKNLTNIKQENDPKKYISELEKSKKLFNDRKINEGMHIDVNGNLIKTKPSIDNYYSPIDDNTFYQREKSQGFLDLRSPMPLYDKRITPQGLSQFKSPDLVKRDNLLDLLSKTTDNKQKAAIQKQIDSLEYTDNVEMYKYDPLAVVPFDMVPAEQQEERIRKYGTSGVPKSFIQQHPNWITNQKNTIPLNITQGKNSIQSIQNNLQPAGLVQNSLNTNPVTIQQPVRVPKSYNIVDTNNQPFGGGETFYKSTDLSDLNKLPAEGWNRKITPQYADGGFIHNQLKPSLNNYLNNNMKQYAQGGQLTRFDEGGTHEQNPLGGIPQGQDGQGNMNTVEQGETKKNNFVYSNRISLDKDLIKQFNLPGYISNKSVADASKAIDEQFKDRQDKYAQETKKTLLERLSQAQEYLKEKEQAQQEQINQSMQANSQQVPDMMEGQIPEGMEEYAEQGMQQNPQEEMMEGQQQMYLGGSFGVAEAGNMTAGGKGIGANTPLSKVYAGQQYMMGGRINKYVDGGRPQITPLNLTPAGLVSTPTVMPTANVADISRLGATANTAGAAGATGATGSIPGGVAGALGMASGVMGLANLSQGKGASTNKGMSALSGAMQGAAGGAALGPIGAGVGAAFGIGAGLLGSAAASRQEMRENDTAAATYNNQFTDKYAFGGTLKPGVKYSVGNSTIRPSVEMKNNTVAMMANGGELTKNMFSDNSNLYANRYALGGDIDPPNAIYGEGENKIKNVQSILKVPQSGNALTQTKAAWNKYQIPEYDLRKKGVNYMYPWQEKIDQEQNIYTAMGLTPGGRQYKQSSNLTPAGVKSISATQQLQESIQNSSMDVNKDGIRDAFANNPNINLEALKNFKIGEGINDNASLSYGDRYAEDGVNFKIPNQTIMTPTDQYGNGVNTGAEQKVNLPETRFSRTMNKVGQGIGENYGQAMRYVPVAMNAYQLSQIRKPQATQYNTLQDKFRPQYVDEAQLQNIAAQTQRNQINALSQSGASPAQMRAAILGSGVNMNRGLSEAYANAAAEKRATDERGLAFDASINAQNAGIKNRAIDEYRADQGNYDTQRSKYLSAIGTDIGSIGKEEVNKDQIASMLGYTWRGKYLVDKNGNKATPQQIAQAKNAITSGDTKPVYNATTGEKINYGSYGGFLKTNKRGY